MEFTMISIHQKKRKKGRGKCTRIALIISAQQWKKNWRFTMNSKECCKCEQTINERKRTRKKNNCNSFFVLGEVRKAVKWLCHHRRDIFVERCVNLAEQHIEDTVKTPVYWTFLYFMFVHCVAREAFLTVFSTPAPFVLQCILSQDVAPAREREKESVTF